MSPIQDAQARQEALDTSQSFIVQAPAGSGKTELLIQRFLKLLARVEKPEHILAMTFTRKASAEMKARIVQALGDATHEQPPEAPHKHLTWKLGRDALAQDKKQQWRLLENPARLKVQTIDSFCSSLVQQTPLLSGFGSGLDVEEKADDLYRETAHQVLSLVEEDSAAGKGARTILQRLDNSKEKFLERIVQLLRKRDLWMTQFFEVSDQPQRELQEQILSSLVQSRLENCARHFTPALAQKLLPYAVYAGGNLHRENPEHPMAGLNNLTAFPEYDIAQLGQWKNIAALLLTKDFNFRKSVNKTIGFPADNLHEAIAMKQGFKDLLETLASNYTLGQALAEIIQAPDPRFDDNDWVFLEAMLALLPEIARILRGVFSAQGKTDFSEIALSARNALGHELAPSDLLLKLDMQLQHILVDEFQDTSYKQIHLLKLLTEGWESQDGRTLFIVGDPMQSIYRFRDALVELFIKIREEGIGSVSLKKIQLLTNFRSQKGIVDWVNGCFSHILPKEDDPNQGAIAFSPSHAALQESLKPGVVLHPIEDAQSTEEADQVVETIQKIQSENTKSTIAILVRGRTHLKRIITGLQNAAINFRAEDIDPLTSRPAILDLLALMRSFLFPMDRVSWLSILRAPWCGLSLDDLHRLCLSDKNSSVWNLMNQSNAISRLSRDGQLRVKRLVSILNPALDSLHRLNFGDVLEGCWLELGGPACMDERSLQDTQVFFDKIFEILDTGDFEALHHFKETLENLYANPSASEDASVQIMTMHKAKGLEFDFVLIPGLGKKSKSNEKQLIFWLPYEENLLLAPISDSGDENSPIYNFLAGMNKTRENYEARRLLYVSATRAKTQLHLYGHTVVNSDGTHKPQAGSHLHHLWPYLGTSWGTPPPSAAPTDQEVPEKPTQQIRRLPAVFETPPPAPTIETGTAIDLSLEEELQPPYEWAGNKARCLGIVIHRYFQKITVQGLDQWDSKNLEDIIPAFRTALLAEGLAPADLEESIEAGMTALRNILKDDQGRNILSQHEDDFSEYALTQVDGNRFINKIIDRTYVEDGVRWIIDYKTGKHEGGNLEKFFEEEKKRYRPQLEGYETLMRLTGETRPIKKILYYPMHQRQVEVD